MTDDHEFETLDQESKSLSNLRSKADKYLSADSFAKKVTGEWTLGYARCDRFSGDLVLIGQDWWMMGKCSWKSNGDPRTYSVPFFATYDATKDSLEFGYHTFEFIVKNASVSKLVDIGADPNTKSAFFVTRKDFKNTSGGTINRGSHLIGSLAC